MMIGNAYQMAYWTDEMPWPRDDGFALFRALHGEDFLDINPATVYPWPLVTRSGKPITISAEMAVVYRFHEFIIPNFPLKDAKNETLWDQNLFDTGFDASGFIDAGLENVVRGILATTIPNFKSGVDESFRSSGKYRGQAFDLATWCKLIILLVQSFSHRRAVMGTDISYAVAVIHEREQGLPTFNQYFKAYNAQGMYQSCIKCCFKGSPIMSADPEVQVKIRTRFEDFSSDPVAVANLKRLYRTPDDVDLVVGVQLDETYFPGTTIPTSAAITSLFSLFAAGNSDRFGIGFAVMRCWLVDKPWDCHPSNALEDLIWKPVPREGFPNFRWYDSFWMRELDLQAHGINLLWRLITENTDIKCLQQKPLFPFDEETNPILCALPENGRDLFDATTAGLELAVALARQSKWQIVATCIVILVTWLWYWRH
jgi:hypothetical protein